MVKPIEESCPLLGGTLHYQRRPNGKWYIRLYERWMNANTAIIEGMLWYYKPRMPELAGVGFASSDDVIEAARSWLSN